MAAVRTKITTDMGSKTNQKDMQLLVHEDSDVDSDNRSSEEEMEEESDEISGGEEGSAEENGDLNEDDEEDVEDEDSSDEEMDSLEGEAEAGDWMEVENEDSDPNSSSSGGESDNEANVAQTEVKDMGYGDPNLHGNAGWADVMSKILRTSKPKGKKSIVLAKAKKLSQVNISDKLEEKKDDGYGFEIDGEATDKKDVKPKVDDLDVKPDVTDSKYKIKRRELLAEGKVRPTILSRERERALSKIATKGVVQLFNAVRDQQKDISRKVKLVHGSVRKEDKIIKSVDKQSFLDSLMGNARSERIEDHIHTKTEEDVKSERPENPSTWNVLRDNFLTGSNMKDWDKCGEIKLEDDVDEVELN